MSNLQSVAVVLVDRSQDDTKIEEWENFDLDGIITPVNVDELERLLVQTNYDKKETEFLVNGFRYGFDIGYKGPMNRKEFSDNIPLRVGNKKILWNKLMKEVKEKRVAGPFKENQIPFEHFIQSPIGLVPKGENKTRMIFHLSYNFSEKKGRGSVNYYTPKEDCSVKYNDIDIAVVNSLNINKRPLYYGKTDLSNAFRILPLSRNSWKWLLMKAEHPGTGETRYFFDKCLPFGSSISCSHFQRFSNAIKYLVEKLGKEAVKKIINYLDNFLFIGRTIDECNKLINSFLEICKRLNIPVADEKTVFGDSQVVFLGILLDGEHFVLAIPEEKRRKAINMLNYVLDAKKVKVKDLEALTGYLNFLNRAIFPGRAFTRRMYAKFMNLSQNLKKHHHLRIDKEFKEDCKVWLNFLD